MKKIVILLMVLVLAGCTSIAQETSTKPISFIDGIELGMTAAEVKLAEGRAPYVTYNDGRVYSYDNCFMVFDNYTPFPGSRIYHFDELGKLVAYRFLLDDAGVDYEVVDLLLQKGLGPPTRVEGGIGTEEGVGAIWELDGGTVLIHESHGENTEIITVGISATQNPELVETQE